MTTALPTSFVGENNHVFTQVKRTDKAAMYRRETADGQFSAFEVFAIMVKDGKEIYPNDTAFDKWAQMPYTESRAHAWFDRFNNGEVVIPQVDPETGLPIGQDKRSEAEIAEPDTVAVSTEVVSASEGAPVETAPVEAVETPVSVETVNSDPTAPEVETQPEVNPTPDGGAVVTVAKVSKAVATMVIPSGEFDQATFATANGLPVRGVVWSRLDELVRIGRLSKRFSQGGKGRPKAWFKEIVTAA